MRIGQSQGWDSRTSLTSTCSVELPGMTDRDPLDDVARLRDRIRSGERGGSERDREALLTMSEHIELVPSKAGGFRHRDILRQCTRMSEEVGGLADALEDRDAAEEIVRWIHRTYDNEHTNQDYRKNLRAFGRYYTQSEEPPEAINWVPAGTSNDFNPEPSERDLITYDECMSMVDASRNERDAALFMVQFEAGCRPGELWDLRVGDVFDSEYTTGLHVDGKLGERSVHLIVAVPYLNRWLEAHPGDESDYLWTKLSKPERPSYPTYLDYYKLAAERAGVSKEATPRNFRRSNTRWLATLGFHQARIEDRQGRERGSEHTARYLAKFGPESNERAYAELHGRDVESDEADVPGPIECPRCHRETPSDREFCMWCHFALSHDAIEQVDAQDERFFEAAAKADGEDLEGVRTLRSGATRYPGVRKATLDE